MSVIIVRTCASYKEKQIGTPMPDADGKLLGQLLQNSGFDSREVIYATLFNKTQPDADFFCGKGTKVRPTGADLTLPFIRGKYLKKEFSAELQAAVKEILDEKPNLILTLGQVPLWAFTQETNLKAFRGTVMAVGDQKLLPTYHPETIRKMYKFLPILCADVAKASRESQSSTFNYPERKILIEPTLEEVLNWEKALENFASILSLDIETAGDTITMVGFAHTIDRSIVIPFADKRKPGWSYWKTPNEEISVWRAVKRVCASQIPKVGQNLKYDIHWLWERAGVQIRNFQHDTMLMHHALQPEMEKGLGFLGSLYTDSPAWKYLRTSKAVKADDE